MRSPEVANDNPYLAIRKKVAAVAAGLLAVISSVNCAPKNTEAEATQANEIAASLVDIINGENTIPIIPGALISDGSVRIRRSPLKLDTVNSALLDGNYAYKADRQKFGLMRGLYLFSPDQIKKDDPKHWAVGRLDEELIMFGVNEETCEHLTYWSRSHAGNNAGYSEGRIRNLYNGADVEVSEKGLTIDPDGYEKSVGLAYVGEQKVEEFEKILKIQGYEPSPFC